MTSCRVSSGQSQQFSFSMNPHRDRNMDTVHSSSHPHDPYNDSVAMDETHETQEPDFHALFTVPPQNSGHLGFLLDSTIGTFSGAAMEDSPTIAPSVFDPPLPPNVAVASHRASQGHAVASGVVLYVQGNTPEHLYHLRDLIQKMHQAFARASGARAKQRIHKALIHRLYGDGGRFVSPADWTLLKLVDIEPHVWDFLEQKCYVEFQRDLDVVAKRGGGPQRFMGHRRYLQMRNRHGAMYTHPETDDVTKKAIAESLVSSVYKSGGHFLRQTQDTQEFYIMDDASATKKAQQALREYREGQERAY